MCANFKPILQAQCHALNLPPIPFDYLGEVYPTQLVPLLFKANEGLQWRNVMFGLVPKWATDLTIARKTYNARNETLLQKSSFFDATQKCHFGVIPVSEFYETKYIDGKPQRWGVRRKDGQAFYIAALYEIAQINNEIVRSASMITMDAIDHPMMREFHRPGHIKRSVIVIASERLDKWLSLQTPDIQSFVEGFPIEEFECQYQPEMRVAKPQPQLDFFN